MSGQPRTGRITFAQFEAKLKEHMLIEIAIKDGLVKLGREAKIK